MVWRMLAAGGTIAAIAACSAADEVQATGITQQPIIYGADDRAELPDDGAPRSLVALIPRAWLSPVPDDAGELRTFASAHGTCPGERFAEQPVLAQCSGVLIGPDLVLTAAHCLELVSSCADYTYVGNYAVEADGGVPSIDHDDQRACKSVVLSEHTTIIDQRYVDFAVIRLEKGFTPFVAPRLRRLPPRMGEAVTVKGTNGGLPVKAAPGVVRGVRAAGDYFTLSADLFAGGCGSGVYDGDGALLGIAVRGGSDFELTEEGCRVSRRVSNDGEEAEEANTLASILEDLCVLEPELEACSQTVASSSPQPAEKPGRRTPLPSVTEPTFEFPESLGEPAEPADAGDLTGDGSAPGEESVAGCSLRARRATGHASVLALPTLICLVGWRRALRRLRPGLR